MNCKTSYVMTEEVFDMLQDAARKTGQEMIYLLFHTMLLLIYDHKALRNALGPVEYQKRCDEETGERIVKRRVKVTMDRRMNVVFQDMRRFYLSIYLIFCLFQIIIGHF